MDLLPYSQSDAKGLRRRDSEGSSLSMELSLEMEAVAISPSASVGLALLVAHSGLGRGKNCNGLDPLSESGSDNVLMPESLRTLLES